MAAAEELGVEDVEEVLRNVFSLEGKVYRDEFKMLCPVHSESDPSCEVNLKSGYWNCWSCPAKGDLVELGCIIIEGLTPDTNKSKWRASRRRIRKLLRPGDPDSINASIQARVRRRRKELAESVKPLVHMEQREVPPWGSYSDGPLKELSAKPPKGKGLTKETLQRWGVRYAEEKHLVRADGTGFTVRNSIAIPILDPKGKPFAWVYRRTAKSKSWQPRFIYTPDPTPPLHDMWFGMFHHKKVSDIAIVEGPSDALMCDQWGIPALAIMGTQVTTDHGTRKVDWLSRFRSVTLMLDNDRPGLSATESLGALLHKRGMGVRVARYHRWMTNFKGEPAGDPGEMCRVDVELLYERAIPWLTWQIQRRRPAPDN